MTILKKFVSYRTTPGLDRYPENERFRVWRETHQHLMRKDYAYARQHQAYIAEVTKASGLLAVVNLPLGLGIAELVMGRFFHWPAVYGVIGIVAGVLFIVLAVARICRLALAQQDYMNQHIAAVLRQRTAA